MQILLVTILNTKSRKIAFFDFCGTLVSFQTADAFVDFARGVEGNFLMEFLNGCSIVLEKIKILQVLNKIFPDKSIEKKLKLLQLRGFTLEKLDDLAQRYYNVMIKPRVIKPVIEEMNTLRENNYEVCIVSAGYSIYLKYFAEEYTIKDFISTEIAFNNSTNICKGTISRKDCIYTEKIRRIKEYYEDQNIDYKECVSYSDSLIDLPLLLLSGTAVVISRSKPQDWCSQYKFKEIIWE